MINPDFEEEELLRELNIIAVERYGTYFECLCKDKQRVVINLHASGFLNVLRENGRVSSM